MTAGKEQGCPKLVKVGGWGGQSTYEESGSPRSLSPTNSVIMTESQLPPL